MLDNNNPNITLENTFAPTPKSTNVDFIAKDVRNKSSYNNTPVFNIAEYQRQKQRTGKIDLTPATVSQSELYTELSSGELVAKYPFYRPGANMEELLAQRQTTSEKWTNGITKFGGKTLTAVLGGTIGVVDGLIKGISEGSLSAAYDSDFNNWLDDLNTKMDYNLPNYYTEQEKDKGFVSSLGTANFWANDVLGALSFTTGAIVSEGMWAAATGGTSLIAKGVLTAAGKLAVKQGALNTIKAEGKSLLNSVAKKSFKEYQKSVIKGGKIVEGLNTSRFLMTSAGYEAGVEARHYIKDTEDQWIRNFEQTQGRKPNAQELSSFRNNLTNSANAVFMTNIGLVGASNLATIGRLALGRPVNRTLQQNTLKKYFFGVGYEKGTDGLYKAVKPTTFQKTFGRIYGIGKPAIMEGVIEEGGQSIAATTAENYILNSYDKDGTEASYSIADSFIDAVYRTYGTKEGFKEVGIGMIVGILGGGATSATTGQGLFDEVGQERKFTEELAEARNAYSNEYVKNVLVERLKASNNIQKAADKGERARLVNDVTASAIADQELLIASIERDYVFQGLSQGVQDFEAGLSTIDDATLAKELGLETTEDIKEWKEVKLAEYKELSKKYKENRDFANALLGSTNIKEITPDKRNEIERGIAFVLSMSDSSNELANTYVQEIKENISSGLITPEAVDALDTQEVLRKADPKLRGRLEGLTTKKRKLIEQRDKISKQLVDTQYTTQEATERTDKLKSLTDRLADVDAQIEETSQQQQETVNAINIANVTDTEISVESLDNQSENVRRLQTTIENIKSTNPQKYYTLSRLFQEYDKAIKYSKFYDKTVKNLTNPELRVVELNGWVSSLMGRFKDPNKQAADIFAEIGEFYTNTIKEERELFNTKARKEEGLKEEIPIEEDGVNPPEKKKTEKPIKIKTSTERIQKQIDEALSGKYAVLYDGDSAEELIKKEPSKKDVKQYNDILEKIDVNNLPEIITKDGYNEEIGIPKEEYDTFVDLNDKLSNWKTLQGHTINSSDSLASLLQLLKKRKQAFEKQQIKPDVTPRDFVEISKAPDKETREAGESLSTIINPNQVVVTSTNQGKSYKFSHIDINTLVESIPNATLYKVNSKGVEKLDDGQSWKEKGNKYVIKTEDSKLSVEVGDRTTLIIDKESFDNVSSEIKLMTFLDSNTAYYSAYRQIGDELVPVEGDFTYSSTLENENIEYDESAVYDLKEGDILRTEINKNDVWNARLLEEYEKTGDKEKLIREVNIYVAPQGEVSRIVGSVRALKENTQEKSNETFTNLYNFRKEAINKMLETTSAKVDLKRTLKVRFTLIGNPNIKVREQDGQLVVDNIEFTDEAISQIEDVGYVQNGEIKTQKGLRLTNKETIFVRSLKDKESKIPLVVFKYKGIRVAFPVTLVKTEVDKSNEVRNIMNSNTSASTQIAQIEDVLRINDLDPDKYDLDPTFQEVDERGNVLDWRYQKGLNDAIDDMSTIEDFADVETWLDKSYDFTRLQSEALISLDITDRPFAAGKTIINLNDVGYSASAKEALQDRETLENRKIVLEQKLRDGFFEFYSALAQTVPDNINPDTGAINNIVEELDNVTIEDRTSDSNIVHKRYANLMPEIINNINKSNYDRFVQNIIGKERIAEIRQEVAELENINNILASVKVNIKDSNLQKQSKSEEICQ